MSSIPNGRASNAACKTRNDNCRKQAMTPNTLQAPMQMLQDRAQRNTDSLDSLPQSPGGQIQQLQEYDFMDSEARDKFNELLDSLKQQMMQNFFQDMKQQLQDMSPEDMEGLKNMIQALNQMLRDRAMGEDPDFRGIHGAVRRVLRPGPPGKSWTNSSSSSSNRWRRCSR